MKKDKGGMKHFMMILGVQKQISKLIGNLLCLNKTESQLGQYHRKDAISFSNLIP